MTDDELIVKVAEHLKGLSLDAVHDSAMRTDETVDYIGRAKRLIALVEEIKKNGS